MTRLSRSTRSLPPAPPVRIVHLGLGNFARAHQAWYTAHAADADQWGIAGFTGRRPEAADALRPQDGLYTLITRSATGDRLEVVPSLVAMHAADEHEAYLDYLARPEVALVTVTVTEAGYLLAADGRLDTGREVLVADLAALRGDLRAPVRSLPAKLVAGLAARRAAGAAALTVLSCDNLPENGAVTRRVVADLADLLDPDLAAWIAGHVDFATSMVDRITPGTTEEDRQLVQQRAGYEDAAPVPTEPFSEWVVSGAFPAGRPAWEQAGVQLVDDVTPFERRKLWLLNGAHSQLAYAGSVRGHQTIAEAIADPACRGWVEEFWGEAARHLTTPEGPFAEAEITAYTAALLQRFENPRARDRLARIAADGSSKLPVRTLPTLLAERAAGRLPHGCGTTAAAWVLHLRGHGAPVSDPGAAPVRDAVRDADLRGAAAAVLGSWSAGLGEDEELVAAVVERAVAISGEDHQ